MQILKKKRNKNGLLDFETHNVSKQSARFINYQREAIIAYCLY